MQQARFIPKNPEKFSIETAELRAASIVTAFASTGATVPLNPIGPTDEAFPKIPAAASVSFTHGVYCLCGHRHIVGGDFEHVEVAFNLRIAENPILYRAGAACAAYLITQPLILPHLENPDQNSLAVWDRPEFKKVWASHLTFLARTAVWTQLASEEGTRPSPGMLLINMRDNSHRSDDLYTPEKLGLFQ